MDLKHKIGTMSVKVAILSAPSELFIVGHFDKDIKMDSIAKQALEKSKNHKNKDTKKVRMCIQGSHSIKLDYTLEQALNVWNYKFIPGDEVFCWMFTE
jgi:hypothetical protein